MRVCAYLVVLALAAFVLFEALLRLYSRVGLRIQFHQIEGYIEKAMRAGANGTRFLLRAPRRRIEFLKLVPRAAPTRFLMIVSSNHCSREQFFQARQRLQEAGISFQAVTSIHKTSRTQLIVECGRDLALATKAAHAVLTGAFGVDPTTPLRAGFVGGVDVREGAVIGWEYPESTQNIGVLTYHHPNRERVEEGERDRIDSGS